jgi:hypothetical protein
MTHLENINAVSQDNPEYMAVFLNYLGESNHNPKIREMINKLFKNLIEYTRQYLGDVSNEDKQLKNLPIMIIALEIGLGTMWTLNNQLYDMDEMEQNVKELISSYVNERKGDGKE